MREEAIIRTLWLSFQYIKDMKVNKTRFCPSPTGLLHLGNLRTSLFSSLSVPWDGVAAAQSFTQHYQENNRSNPEPGVIVGLNGFPSGVYEFTLD